MGDLRLVLESKIGNLKSMVFPYTLVHNSCSKRCMLPADWR